MNQSNGQSAGATETEMHAELNERMLAELTACRQVLIEANFEPIMRELRHFKTHGAATANPLSFHIQTLVDWNKQTQDTRDAFRIELESLGYSPSQIRKLYDDYARQNKQGELNKSEVKTDEN